MSNWYVGTSDSESLAHFGTLGMRWGIRNYQYTDGTLTPAGKERYLKGGGSKSPKDIMKDAKIVNGGSQGYNYGYNRHHNCAFCSVAYELRRRGQDVRAQEALDGVSDDAWMKSFKGGSKLAKRSKTFCKRTTQATKSVGMTKNEFKNMEESILKDGPNSRGMIGILWKGANESSGYAGGHALNYEVKNNKFYVVDSQGGMVLHGRKAFNYMKNAADVKTLRTDNLAMDNKIANKYYVESTGSKIRQNKASKVATGAAIELASVHGAAVVATPFTSGISILADAANMLVAGTTMGVADHVSKKNDEREKLRLQEEWDKENRQKFYSQNGGKK